MNCFFWEHFKCAVRDLRFFIRIILTAIVFSLVRNNHLNMSFGTKSSTFKERDLILHASLVHVLSSSHIIKCIGNNTSTLEELITINFLSFLAYLIKPGMNMTLKLRIELKKSCTGCG